MLLLHLSDIHFRKGEIGTAQDPNYRLRSELIRDVERQCQRLGPADSIVISGDIAFAGDPEEFDFATQWLTTLCRSAGCSMESVFVVPGNHDVVRSSADRNLVQLLHSQIKTAEFPGSQIARQLANPDEARLLYGSLDNYNQFALQFFCTLLPPDRTRVSRDLTLNDRSTLRLWGLNTALVSSSRDRQGDLFLDPASFQITREPGVINLVVAHHHLSWLGQSRELEDVLNDVAPIQIFGHVHTNRIDLHRNYMRLTASAVQPDPGEGNWEPGYNLIELSVKGEGDARELTINAHVRVWQTAPSGFFAKRDRRGQTDLESFELSLELEPWRGEFPDAQIVPPQGSLESSLDTGAVSTEEGLVVSTVREIALRFYQLSFSQKSEIAGKLQLLEDEDMGQPDHERFRRVFIRAHQRGQLEALLQAVLEAEKG